MLDKDDERGLHLLERAMAADPDATRPACERAHEYLAKRADPRAEGYARRWRERAAWESLRESQLQHLDPASEVRPAELTAQQRSEIEKLIGRAGTQLAGAWVARRIVACDPSLVTHVVVVKLGTWDRWRSKQVEVVNALAGMDGWPVHLFFCSSDGSYAELAARVQKLGGAELSF
jgi:hypothetical protein